jgi:1-acyl-sn-glycerol-3-phosphate acyltransferase
MRGWRLEGDVPTEPRAVILAGPHTSNIDGLLLVLLTRSVGMNAKWMVKDTWSKPPMGWVLDPVGAVPIDRSRANGMVGQMTDEFAKRDHFHLMIPPEGTRSLTEHWKSGFYSIALASDVPVVPSYLDYRRKRGGFGEAITLTGDRRADMDKLREFYKDGAAMARYPEKYGPVRLRDEDD